MAVRITQEAVEAIFEAAQSQEDYLVGIYKLVFPNWDQIEKVNGWPSCNEHTWKAICRMAMDWDQKHVSSLAGGAWMNNGFSTGEGKNLPNWAVKTCPVTLKSELAA